MYVFEFTFIYSSRDGFPWKPQIDIKTRQIENNYILFSLLFATVNRVKLSNIFNSFSYAKNMSWCLTYELPVWEGKKKQSLHGYKSKSFQLKIS